MIDVDADIALLEANFEMRPECLRNIKISGLMLKQCIKRGLNLQQIGEILCRPDDDDTLFSTLEKIVMKAEKPMIKTPLWATLGA